MMIGTSSFLGLADWFFQPGLLLRLSLKLLLDKTYPKNMYHS